jgi:CRP-like cAMP-binding protein
MFSVKDLEYLQVRYAKENTKMISFLIENVPELEKVIKRQKLRKFDEIFHEERFKLHHTIVNEGDYGKKIYLLYDGNCHVFKNDTLLCILNPGMFVGEELL